MSYITGIHLISVLQHLYGTCNILSMIYLSTNKTKHDAAVCMWWGGGGEFTGMLHMANVVLSSIFCFNYTVI